MLILDEPDNDLDTDMLAVIENLLDSWPGTLLLITHDRYLMERVTDDQFALLDGKVRHVPGGVDEYLRLLDARSETRAEAKAEKKKDEAAPATEESETNGAPALTRAEEYTLKKELASTERKLVTLGLKVDAIRDELHATDPTDYVALQDVQDRLHAAERAVADLEDAWVELSEGLG